MGCHERRLHYHKSLHLFHFIGLALGGVNNSLKEMDGSRVAISGLGGLYFSHDYCLVRLVCLMYGSICCIRSKEHGTRASSLGLK